MTGCYLRFAFTCLVSVGIGCTSAPVHYHTLAPPPHKTLPASETTLAIDVRVIHTPPQLHRTELTVRTGPTEVTLLENERWASPVNDEIKEAVRLELQSRLGRATGFLTAATKVTIDIDVQRLEAELGRYALLEASWSATLSTTGQRSNGGRATTCAFQTEEHIGAGYAGMVEGYQREIEALADAIVAAFASGVAAPCQQSIEGSAGGPGSKDH